MARQSGEWYRRLRWAYTFPRATGMVNGSDTQAQGVPLQITLKICVLVCRRVASKSKARKGTPSCSPFGKKKKCKDKYLAKHSSGENIT